jgi:hypothetical protein
MPAKRREARTAAGYLLGAACSILLVTASVSRAADPAPAAIRATTPATTAAKPATTAATVTRTAATKPAAASPTAGGKAPTTPGVKPMAALDSTSGATARTAATTTTRPGAAAGAAHANAPNARNAAAPTPAAKSTAPAATASAQSPANAKNAPAPAATATPTATAARPPRAGVTPAGTTPARLAASSKPQGVQNVAHLDQKLTYQYNALGRRDPFQAMIGGEFVGEDVGGDAPVDIGGMKVVGIVWGTEDKFAMVEDGRGQSLVLRVGDKVMNGVVEGLRRDAIVVRITADGQSQSVAIPLTRKGDKSNATR